MKRETLGAVKAPFWYNTGSHHNGLHYETARSGLGTECAWCKSHGESKEATDHFIVGDSQVDLCNWCFNQAKSGLLHLKLKAKDVYGSEVYTSSDKHKDYVFIMSNPDPAQRVGKCEFCGRTFHYEGKPERFCSLQCSRWYHIKLDDDGDISEYMNRPLREYHGVCEICGADFTYRARKDYHRKTCSKEHGKELQVRTWKENNAKKLDMEDFAKRLLGQP